MKVRTIARSFAQFAVILFLPLSSFARCPIASNGTLEVRAAVGNLNVETTGSDVVDVEVNDKQVKIQEICSLDKVRIEGSELRSSSTPQWTIRVPRTISLDLVASAGAITVTGDSDGAAVLRTGGGPVTVGNIKGQTTIVTQGGFIKAGNIGGAAELRSEGNLTVGNVAGNAIFKTAHGSIRAGTMNGKVTAETAGGTIDIADARSEVTIPNTRGGDIVIDNANRVRVTTEGGSIRVRAVHGPFDADTKSGGIRIDQAGSSVDAYTGEGEIEVRLVPENPNGNLHINLKTSVGKIVLYLPERFRASIEAAVQQPAFLGQSIIADFAMNSVIPPLTISGGVARAAFEKTFKTATRNGGGNPVKLTADRGTISIRITK